MAETSRPKKGGKNLTTSPARKMHYAEYKLHKTREKHKIKKILRSCGIAAVTAYAKARELYGYLANITK